MGAMAGSVNMVVGCYTGLEIRNGKLWLHPALPVGLSRVGFSINCREQRIRLDVTPSTLHMEVGPGGGVPIRVVVEGEENVLEPREVATSRSGPTEP